jgi:23S rRNA (guanine745-N1)-methyltransferase
VQVVIGQLVTRAAALPLSPGAVVVDLGAGTGAALVRLAETCAIRPIGIDLSAVSMEHAARRFPTLTWVVANADRRLPLLDESVELVLSIHARRHPAECARVLTRAGHLLIAVPAHDDLIELRTLIHGRAVSRERTRLLTTEHAPMFEEIDRTLVRTQVSLAGGSLQDLLAVTYRGARRAEAARAAGLEVLDVTFASEVCLFRRRGV